MQIAITLVKVGNKLIGRTVSDRWNLATLDILTAIEWTRNQAIVKRLRRLAGDGFTIVMGTDIVSEPTTAEREALSGRVAAYRQPPIKLVISRGVAVAPAPVLS